MEEEEGGGKQGKPGEARAGPYLHGDDPQLLDGEFPHLGSQNLRLVQDGELGLGGAQPTEPPEQRQAQEAEPSSAPRAMAPGGSGGLQPPAAPRHAAAAGEPRTPPPANLPPPAGLPRRLPPGPGGRLGLRGGRHAGGQRRRLGGRALRPALRARLRGHCAAAPPLTESGGEIQSAERRRSGSGGAGTGVAAGKGRRLVPPRCGRGQSGAGPGPPRDPPTPSPPAGWPGRDTRQREP